MNEQEYQQWLAVNQRDIRHERAAGDHVTDVGNMVHLQQALAEQDKADKRVEQWQLDVWQAYVDCYPDEIFNVGTGDYIAAMREMIAEITALKVELVESDSAFMSMREQRDMLVTINQQQEREIARLTDKATYSHAPIELNDAARYLHAEGE